MHRHLFALFLVISRTNRLPYNVLWSQLLTLVMIVAIPCISTPSTGQELPKAPRVISTTKESCSPKGEICGDGIDQDCNGSDQLCAGPDQDRDGYIGTADCDDTDRWVYPGISVPCTDSCSNGTKTCQPSGQFTACNCTPLCEKRGTGRCFYVSKLTGNDSNPGTFDKPWRTVNNIKSYYGGTQPSTWKALMPGDVVYFQSGVYNETYDYAGTRECFLLSRVKGTATEPIVLKAYPGANPVFSAELPANAIRLYQSAFLVLEGLEVAQSYKSGVVLNGTTDSELRNLWVHDIDGVDNDNLAGIYLVDHNNVRIHHSLIHDNYDRTNSDTGGNKTENSRNIVLFSGGTVRIDHNVIFQSPPITDLKRGGVCITYKHAAKIAGAIFEVDHNILWNCSSQSIGSGSPGTRIHHNLILDSDPIRFADFGGPTYLQDMRVENNTIIRGYGLSYQATTAWGPIGLTTVRRNIISDVYPYGADFRGMHRIDPYGSNTLYTDVVQGGKLSFLENCYYNPNYSLSFALFSANTTSTNNLGGTYTFSGWQGIGYDTTSVNTNPTFDTSFTPQSPACAPYGWLAP